MVNGFDIWIITIVGGVVATIGGAAGWHYLKKGIERRSIYQFDLTRFSEKGGEYGSDYVRIQNTGARTIDSCLIYWDEYECRWWDGTTGPRAINRGGGANAVIPNRSDINCEITVKSRGKKLRKMKLMDITLAT